MKIHESQVHRHTDHGQVQFIGEASLLGLAPGIWPTEIQMSFGADETVTFQRTRNVGHEDLVAVVYTEYDSGDYWQLHVLND